MKKILLFAVAFCCWLALPAHAETIRVLSPDRLTYVDISLNRGKLIYTAGYRRVVTARKNAQPDTLDVPMLDPSPLGLMTNVADLSRNLELKKTINRGFRRQQYQLRQGKQRNITAEENAFSLIVTNAEAQQHGISMEVNFRVFNNNIAYNYRLIQGGETSALIVTGEASGFDLPEGTTAFISPQSDAMIGWKRTKPSYEEEYIWDAPAATPSQYGHGWTFPCLFHEGERGWLLISETGLSSNYCGSHLSDATPEGLMTIAFPMPEENNGFGSTGAQMGLAGTEVSPNAAQTGCTPYRTITLSPSLKPIVETTIPWDVVEQLYEPSIDYQGMRNTWSWIIWQDPSIVYDDQIAFIDLAAELGWEGCLIDGGWYQNIGREGMERLFAYCKEKGIRPWVWYNSNGAWNDAPQCARQAMHNPIVRKQEMRWLKEHGVAGIKVDFFAGDKQETLRLYEQILSDANDYSLQVIFHGCTLPRGWERMYPNYCSSEAVLASENLVFNQHFCDMEARNATLHPFCRNAVASMEFGGTVLQKRLSRDNQSGTYRRTSDVFELATAVAFQSSGQNFALTPMTLDPAVTPTFAVDFMRQVPTTWDETCFIDGYPGQFIVLARRSADTWYVVAMNAREEVLKINVQLPMLAGKEMNWIDDKSGVRKVKLDRRGLFKAEIPSNQAIILSGK